MPPSLDTNFIPNREASETSGYHQDYLARLCREGKVEGVQVGRAWHINRHSLLKFIREQEVRKHELAEQLSRTRKQTLAQAAPVFTAPLVTVEAPAPATPVVPSPYSPTPSGIWFYRSATGVAVLLLILTNLHPISTQFALDGALNREAARLGGAFGFGHDLALVPATSTAQMSPRTMAYGNTSQAIYQQFYVNGASTEYVNAYVAAYVSSALKDIVAKVGAQVLDGRGVSHATSGSTNSVAVDLTNISGSTITNSTFSGSVNATTVNVATLTVSGTATFATTSTSGPATFTGTTTISGPLVIGGLNGVTECLHVDANGVVSGTGIDCGSGGGGLTGLKGQYSSLQTGAIQTFATSSDTNIGLTITSAGDVHTFTPTWIGTLGVNRGGTGLATPPTYGQLLLGNGGGGYALAATSTLGISSSDITEGSKLFYTDGRVATYLDTVAKEYFFATSSADFWRSQRDLFSTSSAAYFLAQNQGNAFSSTSASYFLTQNQGAAFSTTSANHWLTTKSTSNLAEGSNLYFTDARVQTYLDTISKGYFYSTTSSDYWLTTKTTDNLAQGSTNKYYSDSLLNTFVGASSTIAKTFTTNVFTALNSFTGGLAIGALNGPLQANNGVVSATTTIGVLYGGTGSTTLTGLLKGNGTNGVLTAVGNTDYQLPITLTTTGSSGAATFNGTTLNIPQYAGATYTGTYPVQVSGSVISLAFGTSTSNTWGGTQIFTNTPVLGTLSGLVGANNGALYQVATTTLYGTGTGGQVLTWNNGAPQWVATTTYSAGSGISISFAAGNLTISNTGVLAVGPAGQTTNGTALFATSTAGTDFTITGSGNTITFNLPTASASNRGLLSASDFATFNNKISSTSLSATYPLAYNSATGVFSTAFGTTTNNTYGGSNTFNGTVAIGSLNGPLQANNGVVSATTSIGALYGGTGSTTLSGILVGNGTAAVRTLLIGSGLTFDGTTLATSGAGITSLGAAGQGQTGGTQTLATSTSSFNGLTVALNIVSAGNTHTFTPSITGTLTPAGGGTGLTTIASSSLLIGGTGNTIAQIATSSLGLESPLTFNTPLTRTGNAVSIQQANGSQSGYLSSGDWNVFNNKISSTSLSATYPLAYNSATGVFSTAFGTTTANTYSALNTFNSGVTIGTLNGPLQANNGVVSATTTIGVLYGGTGSTTLTGLLKGNGTGQVLTAVAGTDYQSPITLTTTGTSGAATFIGNTLNIPQYSGTTYTGTYPVQVSGSVISLAFGTSTSNTWGGTQTFTNTPVLGTLSGLVGANNGALYQVATTTLYGTGAGGQVLTWNNGAPQWVATTTYSAGSGISTSFAAGALTITNTGVLAIGPTGQTQTGTVTIASSTSGTDFTVTASAGTITFNLPTASASNRGLLSSTDWTTFNNKQAALTFTYPLVNSANTVSLAFGTTTANAWSSLQTFNGGFIAQGSTTIAGDLNVSGNATSTNATTTNLYVATSLRGAGLTSCSLSSSKLLWNSATGQFSCGADAGAGGGITALQAQYSAAQTGSTQTFATTSDTNIGLTITSAGDTHTFTPVWIGTLAVNRGGTGQASFTAGQLIYGNGTNALTSVGTTSETLSSEFAFSGTYGARVGGTSGTLSLATNGVAYSKLAQAAANTILGNPTGATGNVVAFATSSLGIALNDTIGTLTVARGGTGTTTAPSGQILYGGGAGVYQSAATGTVAAGSGVSVTAGQSIIGSGLTITNTGVLAVGPAGQTTNGTALFATSTAGTDFTITGSGATITFNLPTASGSARGLLSSTDWTTFNNKQAALTFTYPLVNTGNTVSIAFGTTTSNTWAGTQTFTNAPVLGSLSGVIYGNNGTLATVATSTATLGLGLSGTLTTVGAGNSLSVATSSLFSGAANQIPYFTGLNTLGATSTLAINVGGTGTSTGGVTNGVEYYNGSYLTNSSALTFNGTDLSSTGTVRAGTAYYLNGNIVLNQISGGLYTQINSPTPGNGRILIGNSLADTILANNTFTFRNQAENATLATLNGTGLGLGSTSPYAQLAVHANNGGTTRTLFAIASSTASATSTLFTISNTGVIETVLASGLVGSNNGVLYAAASSTLFGSGAGGQVLTWNNGAPQWVATTTYAAGTGISTSFVAGQLTITNTGITSLQQTGGGSAQTGAITFATSSVTNNGVTIGLNITNVGGAFTFTPTRSGTLTTAGGGTGFSSYTPGDILYADTATTFARAASSTDGFVLALANGKPTWVATTTLSTITGTLGVTKGGTGLTSIASSSLLIGGPGNTFIGYATSSLGIALSDTTGTLSILRGGTGTTTAPVGQLIYGGATSYQSVATGTVASGSGISVTAGQAIIGSGLTITNTGLLSLQQLGGGSAQTGAITFATSSATANGQTIGLNITNTSGAFTFSPTIGGTLTVGGGGTGVGSFTAGQLIYGNGTNNLTSVGTTTETLSSEFAYSGTLGALVGGSSGTLSLATNGVGYSKLAQAAANTILGNNTGATGNVVAFATSTLFGAGTNGFVLAVVNGVPTWTATSSINNGVSSIQQTGGGSAQTGAITFATSSVTNNGVTIGLNVTNTGSAFTFAPTRSGTLTVAGGGTGVGSFTAGQLIYGNGTNNLTSVATTTIAVSGAFNYSGTLGALVGGTGGTLSLATNGVALTNIAQIAANSILANGTGATGNVTALATSSLGIALSDTTGTLLAARGGTGFASYTPGDILYADTAASLARVGSSTDGFILGLANGKPTWVATTTLSSITGTLAIAKGGTGTTTAPVGQLLYGGATAYQSVGTSTVSNGSGISVSGSAAVVGLGGLTITNTGVLAIGPAGQTQTGTVLVASSTTGTDFTVTASAGTITFNLPTASASNRGLLSSSDFTTFNNKQAALTFSYPLVNSANTVSLAFGTTTANAWSSLQTFNGGITTSGTVTLGSLNGVLHAASGVVSASNVLLGSEVSGTLPVGNGGTGWTNIAANTLLLGNGSGALATTSVGVNGQALALVNGVPTWVATTTLATISGQLNLASQVTGTLPVANGGTGSTTLSGILRGNGTGQVSTLIVGSGLTFDGTTLATSGSGITSIGAAGQLQSGGTQTFATSTGSFNGLTLGLTIVSSANTHTFTPSITGTLGVAGGGTGAASFTAGALVYGAGTGALQTVATTTASLGLGLSGTLTTLNAGGTQQLSIATSSLYTGSQGQVAYFSGTNSLVGTSTLFITPSGTVGIGSTTPGATLGVTGSGYFAGNVTATTFAATGDSSTLLTSGGISIVSADTSAPNIAVGVYNSVSGVANSAIGLNNSANTATYSSAVGYGNNASGYLSSAFGSQNTASNNTSGAFGASNNVSGVQSYAFGYAITNAIDNTVMIGPSDAAKLTIRNTGKVGIGTTTPTAQLEVENDTNTLALLLTVRNNYGTTGSAGSRIGFGVHRDIDPTALGASIDAINKGGVNNGDIAQGADLVFNTSPDATLGLAERLRITNVGDVGVGTNTPSVRLSVQGNGLFSGNLAAAGLTATGTVAFTNLSSGLVGSNNGTLYSLATSTSFVTSVVGGTGINVSGATGAVTISNTGLLSLQQLGGGSAQTGAITFATSSATNNGVTIGLNITNSSGAFTFTPTRSGTLTVAGGGTGFASYTPGDFLYADTATSFARVASSTDGFVLALANGKPTWVASTTLSTITGTLAVTKGGTGLTSIASSSLLIGGPGNTILGYATSSLGVALADTTGTLSIARGGTGTTTAPAGQILYGGGAGVYQSAATGTVSGGTNISVTAGQSVIGSGLTIGITGQIGVSNGGTGVGSFTAGQLIYGNGTNNLTSVATSSIAVSGAFSYSGTLGALVGGANGTLSLATNGVALTNLAQIGANTLLANPTGATGNVQAIATSTLFGTGTGGQVLAIANGVPTWVATSSINNGVASIQQLGGGSAQTGAITFATSSATLNGQTHGLNITNSGAAFTFTPTLSGTLTVAGGGTGQTSLSSGQLLYGAGTGNVQSVATSSIAVSGAFTYSGTLGTLVGGTGGTLALATNGVTLANIAQVGANTILGNPTGATGNVQALATSSLGVALSDTTGTLAVNRGGTGFASYTPGDILYADSAASLTRVASSTDGFILGLANGKPTWVATTTLSSITGTLAIAKGGTGTTTAPVGQLLYGGATAYQSVATGTVSSGTGISVTAGQYIIGSGLTITNTGLLSLQQLGGGSAQTGAITFATSSNSSTGLTLGLNITNSSGAFTFTPTLGGTLNVGNGGTGQTSFTSSQILYGNGSGGLLSVATTSETLSSEFSYSGTLGSLVGGSSGTLSLATNGVALNKLVQVGANTILGNNTGATGNIVAFATSSLGIALTDTTGTLSIARGGTGTTTAPVGQLIYGGATSYQSVATGTVSGGTNISVTAGQSVIGSGLTIGITGQIGVSNGGTGVGSFTAGQLIYGNGTNNLTSVATSSIAVSGAFSYSGTLGALVGGANGTLSLATNGVALTNLAQIAANSILANGTGATGNVTALATSSLGIALTDTTGTLAVNRGGTGFSSYTPGDLLYANSATTFAKVASSTDGFILGLANGKPTWVATTTLATISGSLNLGTQVTGTLGVTNGGTGSTTLSGILRGNGTGQVSTLIVGSGLTFDGTTLSSSGSGITAIGPTGQTQSGATITIASSTGSFNGLTIGTTIVGAGNTLTFTPSLSGTLTVAGGGTGVGSFTAGQLIYGNGTNNLTSVATTSASLGLGLSGTLTTLNAGGTQQLSIATSSLYTGTTGQFPYFSGINTITATSSLFLATNGRVGIGTTTPSGYALTIDGKSGSSLYVTNDGSALQAVFAKASTGGFPDYIDGQIRIGAGLELQYVDNDSTAILRSTTGDLRIMSAANNTTIRVNGDRVSIGGDGYGSFVPNARLEVSANGTGDDLLMLSSTNTGAGDRFIVKNGGNVGVGTTSPYGKLSVVGNIVAANFIATTSASSTFAGPLSVSNLAITSNSGLLKASAGGYVVNAVAGTDYLAPGAVVSSIQHSFGSAQTGAITLATSSAVSFNGLTFTNSITNSGGTFTFTPALSGTLGVAGGGTGVGSFTAGQLIYGNGTNNLTSVGTTTETLSSEFAYSGTLGALVGGSAGTLSLATNGVALTKIAQIGANTILGNNTGATGNVVAFATSSLGIALADTTGTLSIARGGTGTTTAPSGQILYGGGAGVYQSVATGTVASGSGISVTAGQAIIGSGLTITNTGLLSLQQLGGGSAQTGAITFATSSATANGQTIGLNITNTSGAFTFSPTIGGTLTVGGGGTGVGSFTAGQLIYGNGTNNLTSVATSSLAVSGAFSYSGTLGALVGGANGTLSLATNGVALTNIAQIAANSVLVNNTSATGNVTAIATSTFFGVGTGGQVLAIVNGVPNWVATSSINNGVSSIQQLGGGSAQTGAITFATSSVTNSGVTIGLNITNSGGAFTFTPTRSGTLTAAGGGTGFASYTPGDILYADTATSFAKVSSTTDGFVLALANGKPTWVASTTLATISGTLGVTKGGTGLTSIASSSLLIGGPGNTILGYATSSLGIALSDTTGTLGATRGGTGLTTIASSSILIGGAGNTWLQYATSSLGINLSDTVGTLTVGRGGTGVGSFTAGQLIYGNGSNNLTSVATSSIAVSGAFSYSGTLGALVGGANGTLSLATNGVALTNIAQIAANTLLANPTGATGNVQAIATSTLFGAGTNGFVLALSGGVPTWVATTTLSTISGQLNLGNQVTSTLGVTNGGTGSTTLSGILRGNGTGQVSTLIVGSGLTFDGTTLSSSGSGITAIGPTGQTQSGATITIASSTGSFNGLTIGTTIVGAGNTLTFTPSLSGTLTVAGGGTGVGSFTAGQLIYGNGTNNLTSVSTSSLAVSGAFSYSGTLGALVGGANGTLSLATNGVALTNLAQIGANSVLVNNTSATGNVTAIATSTFFGAGTGGQVLTWNNGVPQWVATTTYANGSGISTAFAAGQLTITNTGLLSLQQTGGGSAQTGAITFATSSATSNGVTIGLNITNSSGAFTFTPTRSGTLTVGGGGTGVGSFTAGQLIYGNGTNNLSSVGTTTPTIGLGLTGTNLVTLTSALGASSLSIATSSLYTGTQGQVAYFTGTNALAGTSTLFIDTNGRVGVGTSTPYGLLSINPNGIGSVPAFVIGSSSASLFTVSNAGNVALYGGTPSPTTGLVIGSGTSNLSIGVDSSIAGTGSNNIAVSGISGGAGTNNFGLYGGAVNGTNNYGVYVANGLPGVGATNYAFYAASVAQNYFRGLSGFGSTSPFARISIHAMNGDTATTLFAIGSSTASATTTLFSISNTGSTTAANGFNILAGCYAINNTCLAAGVGSNYFTNSGANTYLSTGSKLGIGTTTPWAQLAVNPDALGSGVPSFVIGSSTGTQFVVASNGKVGVGTSTPTAGFTVVFNGTDEKSPTFLVATTSEDGVGQDPILLAYATTTGDLNYARVGIGTTSPWGNAGLRDQLTVDGRIYSTWRYTACDYFGGGLINATLIVADTKDICAPFAFDQGGTTGSIGIQSTAGAYPPYVILRAAASATGAVGTSNAGATLSLPTPTGAASSSPTVEAWVRPSRVATATTTPLYIVGMTNHLFATALGASAALPTNGIYFAASSTQNWMAVIRRAGTDRAYIDTGISTSTTNFQKMRIEVSSSTAIFLMNGTVVAQSGVANGVTLPAATLKPIILVQNVTGSTGGSGDFGPRLDVSLLRYWLDDPATPMDGGPPPDAGPSPDIPYDRIAGAEIAESYLASPATSFISGMIVVGESATSSQDDVRMSEKRYDVPIMGVVSTAPREVLGEETEHTIRVAQVGRVPVIVSLENGPIAKGDTITTSSVPGVGMRANRVGSSVGRALDRFDPEHGFGQCDESVKNELAAVGIAVSDSTCVARIIMTIDTGYAFSVANFFQDAEESLSDIAAAVTELSADVFDKGVAYTKLVIQQVVAKIAVVENLYAAAITLLPGGDLTLPSGPDQVTGTATLVHDTTSIYVANSKVKDGSKIFLTPHGLLESPLAVTQITPGEGFTVSTLHAPSEDIIFDWLMITTYATGTPQAPAPDPVPPTAEPPQAAPPVPDTVVLPPPDTAEPQSPSAEPPPTTTPVTTVTPAPEPVPEETPPSVPDPAPSESSPPPAPPSDAGP